LAGARQCDNQFSLAREKFGRNSTGSGKGGVKRSLFADANGIPLAVVIDSANRHDMNLARPTLKALKIVVLGCESYDRRTFAWTRTTAIRKSDVWPCE
jgi:hypothetical protein